MDWLMLIKTFAVGGLICVVGQLLIDYTSMTPARILVLFVTLGVVLGALGLYQPLVEFANQVSNTDNLIDMNAMAKLAIEENIPIGRNRLFCWLRKNQILMSDNLPYQRYIDRGYFVVKESVFDTASMTKTYQQTYVTGKGQAYIIGRLRKEFLQ